MSLSTHTQRPLSSHLRLISHTGALLTSKEEEDVEITADREKSDTSDISSVTACTDATTRRKSSSESGVPPLACTPGQTPYFFPSPIGGEPVATPTTETDGATEKMSKDEIARVLVQVAKFGIKKAHLLFLENKGTFRDRKSRLISSEAHALFNPFRENITGSQIPDGIYYFTHFEYRLAGEETNKALTFISPVGTSTDPLASNHDSLKDLHLEPDWYDRFAAIEYTNSKTGETLTHPDKITTGGELLIKNDEVVLWNGKTGHYHQFDSENLSYRIPFPKDKYLPWEPALKEFVRFAESLAADDTESNWLRFITEDSKTVSEQGLILANLLLSGNIEGAKEFVMKAAVVSSPSLRK